MTAPEPSSNDRNTPPDPPAKRHYPPPSPTGQPGSPAGPMVPGATQDVKPSTYWPLSIIAFLCFIIFGAIGMYFSAQVTSRWRYGDVAGARSASKVALIIDLCGIAIGMFLLLILASSGGSSSG